MRAAIRVVELYAGTARSVQPFRSWSRAEIALLADNNDLAKDTYLRNFPGAPYRNLDLTSVSPEEVVRLAGGRIDVLFGCPPCQGFSEVGKREPNDPRNSHLRIFSDVALVSKPRVIAMENVPLAALSPEFSEMTERLVAAEYQWSAAIVNSAQFGSCQTRQRLLFIAFDKEIGVKPRFPKPTHGGNSRLYSYAKCELQRIGNDNVVEMMGITPASQRIASQLPENFLLKVGKKKCPTVKETIDDLPPEGSEMATKVQHVLWRHSVGMRKRMANVPQGRRWSGGTDYYSHAYGRLHLDGLARTITASFPYAGSGRYWHPTNNRSITLREAARIQGFPDDFTFLEPANTKDNARLVGNALDAKLAEVAFRAIKGPLARAGPKLS